jgi:hypothetical protein
MQSLVNPIQITISSSPYLGNPSNNPPPESPKNPKRQSKVNDQLLTHFQNMKKKSKMTKQDSDALYNRLMERQGKKRERIAKVKRKYKQEQYMECTYKPKINKRKNGQRKMKGISKRVDEILNFREKKKEELKKRRLDREQDELKNCTFKPKINKKKRR